MAARSVAALGSVITGDVTTEAEEPDVTSFCAQVAEVEVEEARTNPGGLNLNQGEPLSPLQESAIRDLLRHDEGVLVAPPGAGKTRMACAVIAARSTPTLVLVHRKPLLDQWRLELQNCLGLESKEI